MPTYEFACPRGHEFERFLKMSEAPSEVPCPECGERAARRISGGAGLLFKGSGFYLTDYGKNAHRTSGDASKKGGDAGAKSGSESAGGGEPKGGGESKSGGEAKSAGAGPAREPSKGSDAKSPSAPSSSPKKGE